MQVLDRNESKAELEGRKRDVSVRVIRLVCEHELGGKAA
jgi:hypothetical protein